jgi:hypothetical protein
MTRVSSVVMLIIALLAAPLAAEAQSAGKVYRIGELREGPSLPPKPFADAMRELGWIEGQHFKVERRNADRRDQTPGPCRGTAAAQG